MDSLCASHTHLGVSGLQQGHKGRQESRNLLPTCSNRCELYDVGIRICQASLYHFVALRTNAGYLVRIHQSKGSYQLHVVRVRDMCVSRMQEGCSSLGEARLRTNRPSALAERLAWHVVCGRGDLLVTRVGRKRVPRKRQLTTSGAMAGDGGRWRQFS
jgi:hypothetical protein